MNYDKMYGLLGKSLGHSFSKDYFTKKFSQLNLDYSYQNIELENISDIIPFIKENKNLKGFNVTVPYKEDILPFLDEIDTTAKEVGAVNTVKIYEDGRLKGFNTDVVGFEKLLSRDAINRVRTSGMKEALILGSGGASKSVQYVLNKKNIPYKIVSRSFKLGMRNEELGISYEELNITGFRPYSIIINATPVGMFPNVYECLELPYSTADEHNIFIDLIYNPEETLFMKKGKAQGAAAYNGLTMLQEQAEAAWEIWKVGN
ncbi:MAG: shikimate dehydrogenase [Bacteroidales bacterium]|nr:shikimate dehydrogenase [Bacteroidales bacterium]